MPSGIRKEVRGAAAPLTLAGNITGASASLQANGAITGWPTGATYPFVIAIARGTANEERCLCSSLSGAGPCTINITTRGYDDTAAVAHNTGDAVEHVFDVDFVNTAYKHMFDTAQDDHGQYIRVDGTRAFTGLTAVAGMPVTLSGGANSPGVANTLARSDHVHSLSIGTAAILDGAVTSAKIADLTIATGDIADNAITSAKIAAGAVQSSDIGVGAVQNSNLLGNITTDKMSMIPQAITQALLNSGSTAGGTRRVLGTINIPVQAAMYQLLLCANWSGANSVVNDIYMMDFDVYDGTNHYGVSNTVIKHAAANLDQAYVLPPIYVAPPTLSYALTITCGIQRQAGTGVITASGYGGGWNMTAILLPTTVYP